MKNITDHKAIISIEEREEYLRLKENFEKEVADEVEKRVSKAREEIEYQIHGKYLVRWHEIEDNYRNNEKELDKIRSFNIFQFIAYKIKIILNKQK